MADETVERQEQLATVAQINEQTLRVTEEIVNDHAVSASERLKALNLASRTVALNNKSVMDQMRMAHALGRKPSETTKSLTFAG